MYIYAKIRGKCYISIISQHTIKVKLFLVLQNYFVEILINQDYNIRKFCV